MKIKTLVEDTSLSDSFQSEPGLSLYIETSKHKILFDLGASSLFVENAKKLGVNLEEIDTVIISHAHADHGGGLKTFLDVNDKAEIYLQMTAFHDYYSKKEGKKIVYIGLDKNLLSNPRLILVDDYFEIDEELMLFSNVTGKKLFPYSNQNLYKKNENKDYELDDFKHEQNLIVKENGKEVLFVGCAHHGILNILDYIEKECHIVPNYVIGGFHLKRYPLNQEVSKLGIYLKNTNSQYYTCHCTGHDAYEYLNKIMKDQIHYLSTGSEIEI